MIIKLDGCSLSLLRIASRQKKPFKYLLRNSFGSFFTNEELNHGIEFLKANNLITQDENKLAIITDEGSRLLNEVDIYESKEVHNSNLKYSSTYCK